MSLASEPGAVGPLLGDRAPEAVLLDPGGLEARLSFFWQESAAVLVFLRYFGCPFCQAQVVTLRESERSFLEAGASIVLIGHGDRRAAEEFRKVKLVPFTFLLDPDRAAYRAYGLARGGLMQVFGPSTALPFLTANLRPQTRQRGLKGGDLMQMPGTFVVDRDGVVRFAHRNRHVADSPRNQDILEALERMRAKAGGPE
jgi:peroxiredoxin